MTACLVHPDDDHEADRERGWLCCGAAWRRMVGDLAAVPEVWLQLASLGSTERDGRSGRRVVAVAYEIATRRRHLVYEVGPADPVAHALTAGPMGSGWRESQVRSTRPAPVPVSLDVVDLTAGVNHEARRLQVRGVLGLDDDQTGHLSAATVLHRWVLRWAARRGEGEPRRLVGTMSGWLRDRLDWACGHDELLGEFAEELHDLRRTLDGLAGNVQAPPERVDRPCPACGWWALSHDRGAELIRCGHCERALTADEYRDHLEDVIKTNWTRFDPDDLTSRPLPTTPVWVRDDDLGHVTLGYLVEGRWRSWFGPELVAVSYWAEVVKPADPGPAKED